MPMRLDCVGYKYVLFIYIGIHEHGTILRVEVWYGKDFNLTFTTDVLILFEI